jgi:hypothetical protein
LAAPLTLTSPPAVGIHPRNFLDSRSLDHFKL